MSLDIFISYTHKDRELRDELAIHLSSLRNLGIISDWFDGDIIEGTEWEKHLIDHLNTAHIILLLVSADFIASKFCYNIEMKRALARHDANQARVIPIILRPTDWKGTPFAKLKVLPTDGKPVTLWRTHDEAFVDVVKGIKKAIQDLCDSASHTQGKDEADGNLINPNEQPANQEVPAVAQPTTVPPKPINHTRIINNIGLIGGRDNIVNQAGTLHTTITHHYGTQTPDDGFQALPRPNTGSSENWHNVSLSSFKALVDEMNTILDHQPSSLREFKPTESYPEIDPGRVTLFKKMMAAMARQTTSFPASFLEDVHRLCRRLDIVPLI